MNVVTWVRARLIADADINGVVSSRIYPEFGDYDQVPFIVMYNATGYTKNLTVESFILTIKGVENTRALAETLGRYIVKEFDTTFTNIQDVDDDLTVHSVAIANHVPALYDEANRVWQTIVDIKINFTRS